MAKRIIVVDSQRLDAICNCARYYYYRFGSLIRPVGYAPVEAPDYQEKGVLQHAMLDTYYTLRRYRNRWLQNRTTHADVIRSCVNVGRFKANKMALDIADVEYGIETFVQYAEFWENDGWDNIIGVEESGSKILYEDDNIIIVYEVKIDLILQLQNAIVPVDHKTAKSHRAPNELGNQFKGYCWFLGVNNFMVNEIGFQKTYKPVQKFQRHLLSFPQDLIEEWVEQAVYWVKEAVRWQDERVFAPNYTSCDKYSGCSFKAVCTADRTVREHKLRSLFVPKQWDVGKDNL